MSEQKNFVNFHVLISHSPSCLNRDDQNMQKRAVFGGVERIRISSQSLKRAFRCSDYYKNNFDRSTRTRLLLNNLTEEIKKNLGDKNKKESLEKCALFFAALIEGKTKAEDIKNYKRTDKGKIEHQILPFHEEEINKMKRLLCECIEKKDDEKMDFLKEELSEIQKDEKGKITPDVALSGRMATSDLMYPVDGSLACAHAITTHEAQADSDWFTAVDDLIQDSGEVGAAHLDTQEFSSGVFYRYASLNVRQLQENLGGASRERALEIAKHVFHMLCTVIPSAKQQSFAAHNPAEFAIVTLDDQPISLANAFERPVEKADKGGYLKPSVEALAAYFVRMKAVHGLGTIAVAAPASIDAETPKELPLLKSFPAVESWIANDEKLIRKGEPHAALSHS